MVNFYRISPHLFPSSHFPLAPSYLLQFFNTKMSKYTKDSTRFTATGVWAHTKPGRATTLPTAEPAPKNETPAQKVKRLREAMNAAKMAQVTRWDYAYMYGRMAADAAHRLTVYGIIFATGMGSLGSKGGLRSIQRHNCLLLDFRLHWSPCCIFNWRHGRL